MRRFVIWVFSHLTRLIFFLPGPRIMINGLGKSGTHLLSDALSLMPRTMYSGRHFALAQFTRIKEERGLLQFAYQSDSIELDVRRLRRYLRACRGGMFITGHTPFHPTLAQLLDQLGYRQILLVRDPRDVVVSYVHFVLAESWHQHHRYYIDVLGGGIDACIEATINGFDQPPEATEGLASIREIYDGYLAWRDRDGVIMVRFEDLVGPKGGGEEDLQRSTLQNISEHIEKPVNGSDLDHVATNMYNNKSLTFRKGQRGDWRNQFTEHHRNIFKQVAGDLLVELDYEKDDQW